MPVEKTQQVELTNIGYWEQALRAPTPAYQELFEAEREYLVENVLPNARVLDIGCGEGRNIATIRKKTENICGIDNDSGVVSKISKIFSDVPTITIIHTDASILPFENDSFDTVVLFDVFHNLDAVKQLTLLESTRVLKTGGVLFLSTYSETAFPERMKLYENLNLPIEKTEDTKVFIAGGVVSEQFSREELEKLGKEAGLVMIDCQKIGVLAYICKFKK